MGYYLAQGKYTSTSAKAMIDAPQDRTASVKNLVESAGGTLHHFFFSLGEHDFVALYEMPDDISAAAIAMVTGASGAIAHYQTTKLFSAADGQAMMNKAKSAKYAPPAGS